MMLTDCSSFSSVDQLLKDDSVKLCNNQLMRKPKSFLSLGTLSQRISRKNSEGMLKGVSKLAIEEKTAVSVAYIQQPLPAQVSLSRSLRSVLHLSPNARMSQRAVPDQSSFSCTVSKYAQTDSTSPSKERTTVTPNLPLQLRSKRSSLSKLPVHQGDKEMPEMRNLVGLLESKTSIASFSFSKATLSELNNTCDYMKSPGVAIGQTCPEKKPSTKTGSRRIAVRLFRLSDCRSLNQTQLQASRKSVIKANQSTADFSKQLLLSSQ